MSGQPAAPGIDPFVEACAKAQDGCDAGLVIYDLDASILRAAIVFAPEVPLSKAMVMLPLCAVGLQNALGALAPPEVGLHLDWDGGLRLNGASFGQLRVAASPGEPDAVPGWLVVGVDIVILPESDNPGDQPDRTALYAEGCTDIELITLLEAWVRHTLVWINRWSEEGTAPLHREWSGLVWHADKQVAHDGLSGAYLGVDEDFGLLLKVENETHLIPLTDLLETAP